LKNTGKLPLHYFSCGHHSWRHNADQPFIAEGHRPESHSLQKSCSPGFSRSKYPLLLNHLSSLLFGTLKEQ
jgi:hypothetical protein